MSPYKDRDRRAEYDRARKLRQSKIVCSDCGEKKMLFMLDDAGKCLTCREPELYALCQEIAAAEPHFYSPGSPFRSKNPDTIRRRRHKTKAKAEAAKGRAKRVTPEEYELAALKRVRKGVPLVALIAGLGDLAPRGHGGKVGGGPNNNGG